MVCGMAGISRCTTARVASGVTSRDERPVPPVVSTKSHPSSSAQRHSSRLMVSLSSGNNSRVENRYPAPSKHEPARRAAGVVRVPATAPVADGDNCRLIFHSGTSLFDLVLIFIPRTFIRQGQKNPPDAKSAGGFDCFFWNYAMALAEFLQLGNELLVLSDLLPLARLPRFFGGVGHNTSRWRACPLVIRRRFFAFSSSLAMRSRSAARSTSSLRGR